MRLLRLSTPLLLFTACGLGSTVVGEGPPDPESDESEDPARIERTLAAMSSSGPLFVCTFDGYGIWPGAVEGTRLTVNRVGAVVTWGTGSAKFDRVDKSGPPYPTYMFRNAEQTVLSIQGAGPRKPMWTFRGETNEHFDCLERGYEDRGEGVFDEAQLDALVTATNGRR